MASRTRSIGADPVPAPAARSTGSIESDPIDRRFDRFDRADPWRWPTLAPAITVYLLLALLPIANLLAMSLHVIKWDQGVAHWTFNGLGHYAAMPADTLVRAGTANTLIFALAAVAAEMALGLMLALFVSRAVRGRLVYRTIFLLPVLLPGIVIGAIWKLAYNPDFGVINQLLGAVGITGRDWLGQGSLALASVVVVDVWHWTPFVFLLMLAAIESLPQDVHEAATIDGAGAWQEFRHVTFPMLLPAFAVTHAFRLIVSFKVFDEVYLLTGGGPGTATEVISFTIYRRFFTEDRMGYGSAISVTVLFVLTLLIVLALSAAKQRERHR
jgi:multiple sugar transport system permease protein